MTKLIWILLILPTLGHSQKTCARAYDCHEDHVTVSKLTAEEKRSIAEADEKVAEAQAAAKVARYKVIEAHGGYVADECPMGCMMMTGSRLSDSVEWPGDYIILTKNWIPEL